MKERLVQYLISCLDDARVDAELAEAAASKVHVESCGLETFTRWYARFDVFLLEFYPEAIRTPRRPLSPVLVSPGGRTSLFASPYTPSPGGASGTHESRLFGGGVHMIRSRASLGGGRIIQNGHRHSSRLPPFQLQAGYSEGGRESSWLTGRPFRKENTWLARELMAPRVLTGGRELNGGRSELNGGRSELNGGRSVLIKPESSTRSRDRRVSPPGSRRQNPRSADSDARWSAIFADSVSTDLLASYEC